MVIGCVNMTIKTRQYKHQCGAPGPGVCSREPLAHVNNETCNALHISVFTKSLLQNLMFNHKIKYHTFKQMSKTTRIESLCLTNIITNEKQFSWKRSNCYYLYTFF